MEVDSAKLGFIVGHYKSGSTWLLNLLSLHPGIRGVGETHVFRYTEEDFDSATDRLFGASAWGNPRDSALKHQLAEGTRGIRSWLGLSAGQSTLSPQERPTIRFDLSTFAQKRLRTQLSSCSSGDEYCHAFFAFLLDTLKPKNYLIEKTPNNIFHVPRIHSLFPRAKLLSIYRDGRDVVTSEIFHRSRLGKSVASLDQRIENWRDAMEAQSQFKDMYDMLCISYESLLVEPHATLQKILDYLDLPNDELTREDLIGRSSFEFVTGREIGDEQQSFYRKGVHGDWTKHFSDTDKQLFSQIAGDILTKLGYEEHPDAAQW